MWSDCQATQTYIHAKGKCASCEYKNGVKLIHV